MSLTGWGWYQPVKEGFFKAREYGMKALGINPDLAQAHAVLGSLNFFGEHNFEEGRKEYILALKANPPYPPVYQLYAQLLMVTGPIEEARIYINRALELEPFYWVLYNLNAWIYYFEGKHKEAIEACHIASDLKSDYIFTNWLLFLNYAKMGDADKAAEELQTITQMNTGDDRYAAEILEASGKSGIEGLFRWLIDININRPVPAAGMNGHPFFIAWWYAILGNREESVYWLERNMQAKNKMFIYFALIATNPDFDILRNDGRFLAIIDQIGLKPYHTRRAR
jgi:tetratricopeptide (TPR) repeat protein